MNQFCNSFRNTGTMFPAFILFSIVSFAISCSPKPEKVLFQANTSNLPVQTFSVDAGLNEVIAGKAGSIFAIPAGAFLDEMGNTVSGKVDVRIREARDLKTMFETGLQTKTSTGVLSTVGSYSITAFQNEKELKLDPGIGIYAYFPTDKADPEMDLYSGEMINDFVNWKLDSEVQSGIPVCDGSNTKQKECKKCENLLKMSKRIKVGKKPVKEEYWAKRYYWENGVLYFASSGSTKPIFGKETLEDCRKYLEVTNAGQELLAKVEEIRKNQLADISEFYSFRLNSMGWYNIDKLIQDDLISFTGKVMDDDGNPMVGSTVHMYSGERKVHVVQTSTDGTYTFKFLPNENFRIYAYRGQHAGKNSFRVKSGETSVGDLVVSKIDEEKFEEFLNDLI